jgi:hypothetical protein
MVSSRRRCLLVVGVSVCAAVFVSASGGSHGKNLWAGKWNTSTGSLSLRLLNPDEVETAKSGSDSTELWNKLPCKSGPQFYRGAYATGQGDKGKVLGCGTPTQLQARFLSTGKFRGAAGSFSIRISDRSPLSFTGTYREDSGGSGPYTGTWSNHFGGDNCCTGGSNAYDGPFEVHVRFHANALPTAPPFDGGRCPETRVLATVTGEIIARRTADGDIQGGGNVADRPFLSRCRVPAINVRVDDVELQVLTPGKRLRAVIDVRISGGGNFGVHRPGDCKVNTRGRIVAIYDDTSRAANSLRNDQLVIGPWQAPGCIAHVHTITNSISSITADASGSTWVRTQIECWDPAAGTGKSPRNCT